jgi:hypothetical protein
MAVRDKARPALGPQIERMTKAIVPLLSLCLAGSLTACTTDDTVASTSLAGSDSVATGEVSGTELVVHEAIAVRVDDENNPGVAIILTDRPGACAGLKEGAALASSNTLTLFVADDRASSERSNDCAAETPAASFTRWDSRCSRSPGTEMPATGGYVSLQAIRLERGGRTMGTFALNFGNDVLVGKFAAVYCDIASTAQSPLSEASSCQ